MISGLLLIRCVFFCSQLQYLIFSLQGKLLTVPERVPFRMTADMVDGMGISGTQGVFQRCAEETLRVLREGSEVIMTVLEVFKHDPLHSWSVFEVDITIVTSDVLNQDCERVQGPTSSRSCCS